MIDAEDAMAGKRWFDEVVSELAVKQYGLVTRAQLLAAGLPAEAVRWQVRSRRLRSVQRGVYQVGPLRHPRARVMAAVLACGPGAVVSHWSAGALWELCPERGDDEPVDVTVPGADRGRRPGIRAHCVNTLPGDEATQFEGIAVTVPARTLLDLAGKASPRELERAVARALRKGLTDRATLLALARRRPRRPGVSMLRSLVEAGSGPALTRSEAEERFLALVRKADLPQPEVNAIVERYEVDFLWRPQRVVVEIDGFAFHSSRSSFESDRARDATLAARGFRVVRVTWRQITTRPEATLVRLAQTLTA